MFEQGINKTALLKNWGALLDCEGGLKDETLRMSTAIVLENTQREVDYQSRVNNTRGGLLTEAAGVTTAGAMGPFGAGASISNTAADGTRGDARVPSVVLPMLRRFYPNLLAHKLVGVQPMTAPVGVAYAYRAKYGRFRNGNPDAPFNGGEIGYNGVYADFTGKPQLSSKYGQYDGSVRGPHFDQAPFGYAANSQPSGDASAVPPSGTFGNLFGPDQGQIDASNPYVSGGIAAIAKDPQSKEATAWKAFFGENEYYMNLRRFNGSMIGDGADTSDAENWAVGSTMPEAAFDFLKATVTAKTRKLGTQITRETEEDMKAMQGMNAQDEISNILSYEIAQEIDRQLLGEIIQAAVRANNVSTWDPALADGRNQNERVNALYTDILTKSAQIATQSRRGAANWCVASPGACALLEAHIVNPLSVHNVLGKPFNNDIGVVEVGALRNGTIKLYRDSLAGGDYILLGYKGKSVYDTGVIYLPYVPLQLMTALDPFTMNPITAARTRYGVTTNLFGAGQFYHFIALPNMYGQVNPAGTVTNPSAVFTQH